MQLVPFNIPLPPDFFLFCNKPLVFFAVPHVDHDAEAEEADDKEEESSTAGRPHQQSHVHFGGTEKLWFIVIVDNIQVVPSQIVVAVIIVQTF